MSYGEAVEDIRQQWAKRRITAFAKKHSVEVNEVEIVDETPIEDLEKEFKKANNIKKRIYKNLSEGEKKGWITFYNDHMNLSLRIKGEGIGNKVENAIKEVKSEKVEKTEKLVEPVEKVSKRKQPKVHLTHEEKVEKKKKEVPIMTEEPKKEKVVRTHKKKQLIEEDGQKEEAVVKDEHVEVKKPRKVRHVKKEEK